MFFLSYASTDRPVAQALVQGLKEAGVEVWFDSGRSAMVPGRSISEQLERKLQESQGFLLLVGKRGVDGWVRAEVDVALSRNVKGPTYPIIPLLLPEVGIEVLPPFIARFSAVKLEGELLRWSPQAFQEVAARLKTLSPHSGEDEFEEGPFPGLESFEKERSRFYFGRDGELREAVARLGPGEGVYRRWLEIEGPSGAGKSSLVRAGLVPTLQGGWGQGAWKGWQVAVMRPGKGPVHQLARALVHASRSAGVPDTLADVQKVLHPPEGLRNFISERVQKGQGFLLVVDQLEEALVLSEDTSADARHLDALLATALEDSDSPFHLITTLRSDFLGRFDEALPRLSSFLNARWTSRYYLHTLKAEALRQALLGPAQLAGLHWEEGLPGRILQDAEAASGGLPLVAHVLQELWKRRGRQGELTHTAYEAIGGVGGALTLSADALLATFTAEEQARVRKLLLALVKVGHGMRDVRRTRALSEALEVAGGPEQGHDVLLRLSGGRVPQVPLEGPSPPRLLVVEEERVELIHEALLEQWRTLRDWLKEDRSALEKREALDAAAKLWERTRELPGEAQLRYLRSAEPVDALSRAFLEAVSAHEQRLWQIAQARELLVSVQQTLAARDPQLSLLLILEAYRLAPTEKATDVLVKWYLNRQRLLLGASGSRVNAAALSPDGRRILTANQDDTLSIWDATSGQLLTRFQGHAGLATIVAFSPDGERILEGSADGNAYLWDAASGQCLARLGGHAKAVATLAFSPDGRHILTAYEGGVIRLWRATGGRAVRKLKAPFGWVLFSPDGSRILTAGDSEAVTIWDARSGQRLLSLGEAEHLDSLYEARHLKSAAAFSPDGQRVLVALGQGHLFICESVSGRILTKLRGSVKRVRTIAFSPDGRKVFTGDTHGHGVLYDVETGEVLSRCEVLHEAMLAASFSPHGECFLTANNNGRVHLGDVESGGLLAELRGHSSGLDSVAFSADGQSVLTKAGDGTARLWETAPYQRVKEFHGGFAGGDRIVFSPTGGRILLSGYEKETQLWEADCGRRVATLQEAPGSSKVLFSPDGRYIFAIQQEGPVLLWDGHTGQRLIELQAPAKSLSAAAFSQDGQHLLTGNQYGKLQLWSTSSGQLMRELTTPRPEGGYAATVNVVAFSPDGQRLLSCGGERSARVWDAVSGQQVMELPGHLESVFTAMFSPNGQRILTMSWERRVHLWSAATGRLLAVLEGVLGIMRTAAFDSNGRRLLTTDEGSTVRLWEAESGRLLRELRGHTYPVIMAGFSPNGRMVLTVSRDHTARIWDAASGQLVGVLRGPAGPGFSAAFGPDGWILTSNGEGTAYLWECELFLPTEALFERARARVVRELTEEERKRYLHGG